MYIYYIVYLSTSNVTTTNQPTINNIDVQVLSRAEDKAVLAKILSEAIAEYRAILKSKGNTLIPHVTISEHVSSSSSSCIFLSLYYYNMY